MDRSGHTAPSPQAFAMSSAYSNLLNPDDTDPRQNHAYPQHNRSADFGGPRRTSAEEDEESESDRGV